MLKKALSTVLTASLLVGSLSIIPTAAVENNDANSESEQFKTITLRLNNNLPIYEDQNGNDVDPNTLNEEVKVKTKLPAHYDLRDYDRVTGIKDQGEFGTCWSFASIASMESSILTQGLSNETADTLDLSEAGNTWYLHTNTTDTTSHLYNEFIDDSNKGTSGGNAIIAANSISSGYGTYPESEIPYRSLFSGCPEAMRFYSDYRLKNSTMFDNENVDLIKQTIADKGALYLSYNHFRDNFYHTADGQETYYDNGVSIYGDEPNNGHAVTVIGWDDNFSKDNFHPDMRPKHDGAWLCKNSWGEDPIGLSYDEANPDYIGYFWISYENESAEIAQFEMQSAENLDNIYQHQTSGLQYINVSNSANVFTANSNEKLEQICFSNYGKADVKISIYKLSNEGTLPEDGKLVSSFETSFDSTGTHMVDCPDDVMLSDGDVFSIVIEDNSAEQEGYYIETRIENTNREDVAGYSYVADTEEKTWFDVADDDELSYTAIKAYTSNVTTDKSELSELVATVKNLEFDTNIDQAEIDKFNETLNSAKTLLADTNASQHQINNTVCVLESQIETLKNYCFYINSVEDFIEFNQKSQNNEFNYKQIELTTDLDLDGYTFFASHTYQKPFIGTFNGNNHTIKNFKNAISNDDGFGGIFGAINNSTIKNLTIESSYGYGDFEVGLLCGDSSDSQFINCKIKDSVVQNYSGMAAGLISGESDRCKFIDCTLENVSAYSGASASLYTGDTRGNNTFENCTAEKYTLKCTQFADNNTDTIFSFEMTNTIYNGWEEFAEPLLTMTDDECILEEYMGKITPVEYNGKPLTISADGKYHFEKTAGEIIPMFELSVLGMNEFGFKKDVSNKSFLLVNYSGTNTDIVIPSQLHGAVVSGFSTDFKLPSDVTSLNIPESIKEISDGMFVSYANLKSVTLGKNIEKIGKNAFGYFRNGNKLTAIEDFVIYGYADTVAETYANDNGFRFVDLSTSGDVNLDGVVSVLDATLIQKYLVGNCTLTETQLSLADVDHSSEITIHDATKILKLCVGIG